ncbi:MAG: hypothetical protein RBS39_08125 [Phycisphaerales bacterium]|nr:hypothetical protein [Phycisphaerales bacterium]
MATKLALILAASLLASCGNAYAWQPKAPTGGGDDPVTEIPDAPPKAGWVRAQLINGVPVLTDTRDGTIVVARARDSLYEADKRSDVLAPSVSMLPKEGGCDLVLNFHNDRAVPMKIGRIRIGNINLGPNVTWQDFDDVGQDARANAETWVPQAWVYPENIYSPVAVFRNDKYAVGVSLHYPVIEWEHQARLMIRSPRNPAYDATQRGWEIEFRLSSIGEKGAKLAYDAILQPGERRTYTIAIRVTDRSDEWVRTLVPYRDYFQSLYGGVDYVRDPRPVNGGTLAAKANVSGANPDGWAVPADIRMDRNGWRPLATQLTERAGWDRHMLWHAPGHYKQDRTTPFWYATAWNRDPELAQVFDKNKAFGPLLASGDQLGFWWTFSALIRDRSGNIVGIDPDDPWMMQQGYNEIDAVARTGATLVGMDAFSGSYSPGWNRYKWIKNLHERQPQIKFILEPHNSDVMHNLAPTWIEGLRGDQNAKSPDDFIRIRQSHILADLLNPGHETWMGWDYRFHRSVLNIQWPDSSMIAADAERIASMGYVPCIFWSRGLSRDVRAVESWKHTIPADIRAGGASGDAHATSSIALPNGFLPIDDGGGEQVKGEPPPTLVPAPGQTAGVVRVRRVPGAGQYAGEQLETTDNGATQRSFRSGSNAASPVKSRFFFKPSEVRRAIAHAMAPAKPAEKDKGESTLANVSDE